MYEKQTTNNILFNIENNILNIINKTNIINLLMKLTEHLMINRQEQNLVSQYT